MKPLNYILAGVALLSSFAADAQKKKNKHKNADITIGRNVINHAVSPDRFMLLTAPTGVDKNGDGEISEKERTGTAFQIMYGSQVIILQTSDEQDSAATVTGTLYLEAMPGAENVPQNEIKSNVAFTRGSIEKTFNNMVEMGKVGSGLAIMKNLRSMMETSSASTVQDHLKDLEMVGDKKSAYHLLQLDHGNDQTAPFALQDMIVANGGSLTQAPQAGVVTSFKEKNTP